MGDKLKEIDVNNVTWKTIREDGLDLDYAKVIPRPIANILYRELEDTLEYFTGDLSKIK